MAYTYNGIDYNSRLDISIRARNLVYQADYQFEIALSDAEAVYLIRKHKDEIAE